MDDVDVSIFAKLMTAVIFGVVFFVHKRLEKKRSGNVYKLGLMFLLGAYVMLFTGIWFAYNTLEEFNHLSTLILVIHIAVISIVPFGFYSVLVVHRHKLILNDETFIVRNVKNQIVEMRYDAIRLVEPPKFLPFITFNDEEGQRCSVINQMPGINILVKRIKQGSGGKVKGFDKIQLRG